VILKHQGVDVIPRRLGLHRIRNRSDRVWVDEDPLVLYHFSRVQIIAPRLYDSALWHFGHPLDPILKHQVYAPYVRELRAAACLVQTVGSRLPSSSLRGQHRGVSLFKAIRHRTLLVVGDSFVL
jgi:hypothetical protein